MTLTSTFVTLTQVQILRATTSHKKILIDKMLGNDPYFNFYFISRRQKKKKKIGLLCSYWIRTPIFFFNKRILLKSVRRP
jgi:hypothetical protein